MKTNPQDLTVADAAIQFVCGRFGITVDQIESHCRAWPLVWYRWLVWHLVRLHTNTLGWRKLGYLFNRNPSAIYNAVRAVKSERETNRKRSHELGEIEREFAAVLTPQTDLAS